jgi:23S rRNA (uracil1939-C5)-methyltransferase
VKLCQHFGLCGGCSYQELPADAYRELKRGMVVDALAQAGLANTAVSDPIEVPPNTRRRAVFKIAKRAGAVQVGFHAAQSHAIVDMRECLVLTPKLFALTAHLREIMGTVLSDGDNSEVHATDTDTGIDMAIRWPRKQKPETTLQFARWAQGKGIARVTANGDIITEQATPSVRFGKAKVALPLESFLQPTREGEAALLAKVREALGNAKSIADFFAGCGTFSLPLAENAKIHAVEQDKPALAALAEAARNTQGLKPVTTEARDLFKIPVSGDELKPFDAALLDPPRAGAQAQVAALAVSKIKRIAYVSCNAASFARDARVLADAGFKMSAVTPVDQFLWSSHIELVAGFRRS